MIIIKTRKAFIFFVNEKKKEYMHLSNEIFRKIDENPTYNTFVKL